jgi:hypothetical protein
MSNTQSDDQSKIQWYIQVGDGKKAGPVPLERLQQLVKTGKVFPNTHIRSTQSGSTWIPANTVSGLFPDHSAEPNNLTEPESPKNDQKSSSIATFMINVGGDKPKADTTTKNAFKINPKKSEQKEKKEEKSEEKKNSSFFSFGTKPKSEEKKEDKNKTKTSDKSAVAVKIAIGTVKDKDKNKDEKKTSEKSSTLKIVTDSIAKKETHSEEVSELIDSVEKNEINEIVETTEPEEFTVEPKAEELKTEKRKSEPLQKTEEKIGIVFLLLITAAVLSVFTGLGGGIALTVLGFFIDKMTPFSCVLGSVVFVYGIILGVVSLSLALLFRA